MSEPYAQEYLDRGTDRLGLHVYPDPGAGRARRGDLAGDGHAGPVLPAVRAELGGAGLAVVVVDLRGTGSSTPAPSRSSRYGYAELAGDVGAVLDALKPRLDGRRRYLLGHSLGGQACALHLALDSGARRGRADPGRGRAAVVPLVRRRAPVSACSAAPSGSSPSRPCCGCGRAGASAAGRPAASSGTGDTPPGTAASRGSTAWTSSRARRCVRRCWPSAWRADQYTPRATLDHLCGLALLGTGQRVHLTEDLDHFTWVRSPDAVAARVAEFVVLDRLS